MAIKPDPAPRITKPPGFPPKPDPAPAKTRGQLAYARQRNLYRAIARNNAGKGGAATAKRLETGGVLLNPPKPGGRMRFPSSNGRYTAGNGGTRAPRPPKPDAAPKAPRTQKFPSSNGRYTA